MFKKKYKEKSTIGIKINFKNRVDNWMTTENTIKATIKSTIINGAQKIVLAIPVAPKKLIRKFKKELT